MIYTKILGTGSYVPPFVVTNKDLEKLVETSDEWIQSRTGIKERHMSFDENTSDLALKASLKAIEDAQIDPSTIDLVIVATVTPDFPFPGVANILQRKLGLNVITAFDINAACTGFIYALNIADKMIKSGAYKRALIVGAEILTKYTDFEDRNTCVLFADAAGAMIIDKCDTPKIKDIVTYSKGDLEGLLRMEGYPLKKDFKTNQNSLPFIKMQGTEVFKFATKVLPDTVLELLERTNHKLEDLTMIVAHQANQRIIDKAARVLDYPIEQMFMNIDKYGNTSAASVPLAIDEAIKEGKLKKGDLFVTVAFGAGLTWGGAMIEL
ncbi:beta-ketoacyl-ACP synthase III [Liberiplasma polymorphum]|uniref:beta-ketoacyl-ACP synthase III n=1 Tax=Liberiplasma polymorphum TaxID=3374570 RepID=UPI003774CFFD